MSAELFLAAKLVAVNPRTYRYRLPQGVTLPALTYQRIGTVRGYAHDGDEGLPTARFQVDAWANDADVCDAQATAVIAALSGFANDEAPLVRVDEDRELDDPNTGLFRRSVDLLITYQEA